jgi:SagB-type dehydrogenase family enzyme
VTGASGERSAPSAGATYPLDLYLAAGSVTGLPPGIYRYGQGHDVTLITKGDQRQALSKAALGQSHVAEAPATLIITATYERTTQRYGDRGVRYVHMEAGHAAQNVCLQAVAMGLGTVVIGAFEAESINHLLWLLPSAKPIYLISAGRISQES